MLNETAMARFEGDAFVPEDSPTFRMARLLLLLSTARSEGRRIESLDRLTYYEFFADNPWVVIGGNSDADATDRDTLRLAGFSRTQLSYASTGQRFVSRRGRIRADFAQLTSYGLAEISQAQFRSTNRGDEIARGLQSSYAYGYRSSASIVLRRLIRLPSRRLELQVEDWLGHSWLLLDLLDDVRGADVPAVSEADAQLVIKSRLKEGN